MTKKEMKRIEKIVEIKGLQNNIIINIEDLLNIAKEAECKLNDVMYYFRFCRRF